MTDQKDVNTATRISAVVAEVAGVRDELTTALRSLRYIARQAERLSNAGQFQGALEFGALLDRTQALVAQAKGVSDGLITITGPLTSNLHPPQKKVTLKKKARGKKKSRKTVQIQVGQTAPKTKRYGLNPRAGQVLTTLADYKRAPSSMEDVLTKAIPDWENTTVTKFTGSGGVAQVPITEDVASSNSVVLSGVRAGFANLSRYHTEKDTQNTPAAPAVTRTYDHIVGKIGWDKFVHYIQKLGLSNQA